MFSAELQGTRLPGKMQFNPLHFLSNRNLSRLQPLSVPDTTLAVSNPSDVFDKAVGAIMKGDAIALGALLLCPEVCTCVSCDYLQRSGGMSIVARVGIVWGHVPLAVNQSRTSTFF
jgi:hypothetical protein